MKKACEAVALLLHLAPLAGRGRIALAIRVRGYRSNRNIEFAVRAPHPNPLPASGAREQRQNGLVTMPPSARKAAPLVALAAFEQT